VKRLLVRARGGWEDLQDSLWLIPAVGVVLAIVLARSLVALEPVPDWVPAFFAFTGSPDGARSVLTELAGATFTVVGVVFSLTVVALQMASSQFTPRLLRTFLKDRSVQFVLSGMVSSGVFHVAVLRHVRSPEDGEPFVPQLAVTVALLFALVAVGLLVYFLHHLTSQLRVEVVMSSIRDETIAQLRGLHADREELPDERPAPLPSGAVAITSRRTGYLQTVDLGSLVQTAERLEVSLLLRPSPSEWVAAGTTLAWAWDRDGDAPGADADELADAVHAGLYLGPDRTETGDVVFGLRQLVDIAARALSTGVNDPTTAREALQHLSAVLVLAADHPLGVDQGLDDDGQVRVTAPRPTFADHLEIAIGEVRRYGAAEPAVLLAVLALLTDVAERVADTTDRADAVRDQVERTRRLAELDDPADEDRVERAAAAVLRTLEHGHRPPVS
jgi:uncharacterized membrane protein